VLRFAPLQHALCCLRLSMLHAACHRALAALLVPQHAPCCLPLSTCGVACPSERAALPIPHHLCCASPSACITQFQPLRALVLLLPLSELLHVSLGDATPKNPELSNPTRNIGNKLVAIIQKSAQQDGVCWGCGGCWGARHVLQGCAPACHEWLAYKQGVLTLISPPSRCVRITCGGLCQKF